MHSLGCGVSMYLSERCLFLLSDSGRGSPLSRREMIRLYSRGLGWHALSANQLVAVLVVLCSSTGPSTHVQDVHEPPPAVGEEVEGSALGAVGCRPTPLFQGVSPILPCVRMYICRLRGNSTGACVLISVATAPQVGHIHIYIYMYVNTYIHT